MFAGEIAVAFWFVIRAATGGLCPVAAITGFESDMTRNTECEAETETRLVFLHIPKTAGTSLLHFFRAGFGANRVFVFGPHSRCTRFFEGKTQLEEAASDGGLDRYRVFQGHGIDEATVGLLGRRPLKMMVVLRSPASWAHSRWRQYQLANRLLRKPLDPLEFLFEEGANHATSWLLRSFPGFVDAGSGTDLEKARSVLRKFDYVFTMEKLASQIESLRQHFGIAAMLEEHRVSGEKTGLPISDEEIMEIHPDDAALHSEADHILAGAACSHHNAFGFDQTGRDRALTALTAHSSQHPASSSSCMYVALSQALCRELRAPAALALIEKAPDWVPVRNPEKLAYHLRQQWPHHCSGLAPELVAKSKQIEKRWIQKITKNVLPTDSTK